MEYIVAFGDGVAWSEINQYLSNLEIVNLTLNIITFVHYLLVQHVSLVFHFAPKVRFAQPKEVWNLWLLPWH